jgi:hypothetical protein
MSETNDLRFMTTTPGSCGTLVETDSSQVLEDRLPTARRHQLPAVSREAENWPSTPESGRSMVAL